MSQPANSRGRRGAASPTSSNYWKSPAKIQREEKAVQDDVQASPVRPASGMFIHGYRAVTSTESKMPGEVITKCPQALPGQIRTVIGSAETTDIALQAQIKFPGEVELRAQTDNRINQPVRVRTVKINYATRSAQC